MSVWSDMHRRSTGVQNRKEDDLELKFANWVDDFIKPINDLNQKIQKILEITKVEKEKNK